MRCHGGGQARCGCLLSRKAAAPPSAAAAVAANAGSGLQTGVRLL